MTTMATALMLHQPETPSFQLLKPLLEGKPVVLHLHDDRLPKRKRAPEPLLFITPAKLYEGKGDSLVVSLQTHGCEIVDIYPTIDPMVFYRMGINMHLSKALSRSLNDIFHQKEH